MSGSPGAAPGQVGFGRPPQSLTNFTTELAKCLTDLRDRRDELKRAMLQEEEEKARIQKEISLMTDRLNKLNESLVRKGRAMDEYERTIAESEQAYSKIVDSSEALLNVLKKERDTLGKRKTG